MMKQRLTEATGSLNSGSPLGHRGGVPPPTVSSAGPTSTDKPPRIRLACLDSVRGLNVMLMIFVDNVGDYFGVGINHSPWDDITLADFVMPLFLFMVGVSMAQSFKKTDDRGALARKVFVRTAKLFVLGCLTQGADVIGYQVSGVNLATMRIPGILQRIAWAYCIVALMDLYLPKFTVTEGFVWRDWKQFPKSGGKHRIFTFYLAHWLVAFLFLFVYVGIMLFMLVPSWTFTVEGDCNATNCTPDPLHCALPNCTEYQRTCTQKCYPDQVIHVKCNVRGDLSPKCSALRTVDEMLLGWNHLYNDGEFRRSKWCSSCHPYSCQKSDAEEWCKAPLDPEGTLASLPTVLTTWLGMHFGKVLNHHNGHKYRIKHWTGLSIGLMMLGCLIHFVGHWKMNKQSWSPSYLFFMSGACGALLTIQYLIYDLRTAGLAMVEDDAQLWQRPLRIFFTPARWVGMNTIFIYLFSPAAGLFENIQSLVYFRDNSDDNVVNLAYDNVFCHNPTVGADHNKELEPHNLALYCHGGIFDGSKERWAILTWTIVRIAFWVCVAGWLHKIKWYWAL